MPIHLLPTTVVGSYPQPDWLVDRVKLKATVPRVRTPEIWRVAPPYLEQAQDDATRLAIRDMERAGIDVITDGEIRRESYSNRFATDLEGIDANNPATIVGRLGRLVTVPRVVGKIRHTHSVEVRDAEFLRRNTRHMIKITLPGPFTMAQQAKNEFYKDEEELAFDLAVAVNEEAHALKKAGVDVVQLDEPWLQAFPEAAARYGVKTIDRALKDLPRPNAIHICFGYSQFVADKKGQGYANLARFSESVVDQISIESAQAKLDLGMLKDISRQQVVLGVIDLGTAQIETPEEVAWRIREALKFLPPERLVPAPDCGMKYMDRAIAFGKLKALSAGAAIVRREII